MRRARKLIFLNLDLEIERTLRRLRKERRERVPIMTDGGNQNRENQEQQALRDYFRPVVNDNYSRIQHQTINTNNFELKLTLINIVQQNQYGGLAYEDPNVHLATFLEICDIVKMNGVTEDVIRIRLFSFFFRDKARGWLQSLQPGSIGSWEELAQKFLTKFFPPSKLHS